MRKKLLKKFRVKNNPPTYDAGDFCTTGFISKLSNFASIRSVLIIEQNMFNKKCLKTVMV